MFIFYPKMEGLLNEIENVIDSYLDKSTVSESLDVKNELDAEEIRDKELDSNDPTGTLTENELDADDIKDKELDSKDPTATLTENELDAEHIQNIDYHEGYIDDPLNDLAATFTANELETEDIQDIDYMGDFDDPLDEDFYSNDPTETLTENDFSDYRIFSCSECTLRTNSEAILRLHLEHGQHNNWLPEQDDVTTTATSEKPLRKVKKIKRMLPRPIKKERPRPIRREIPRNMRRENHAGGRINKCSFCEADNIFETAGDLREHIKLEHPGKKVFYCSEPGCDYGTNYTGNLRMHREGYHSDSMLHCDLCTYRTKWKPTLLEHKRHKHGIYEKKSKYFLNAKAREPTQCPQCPYVASSQKFLVIHLRSHHRETGEATMKCDQCSFVSHNEVGLNHHKRWIHSGKMQKKTFNCNHCDFTVDHRSGLLVHKREVHGTRQRDSKGPSFKCKLCEEKIRGRDNYRKHRADIHGLVLKTIKCWFCDFKSSSATKYHEHKNTEHPDAEYNCPKCSFVAKRRTYVEKHMENLHNETTFLCDQCDTEWKSESYLKLHKMRKHEVRKYACDQCDYRGVFQCNLNVHKEKSHNSDKPIIRVKPVKIEPSEIKEKISKLSVIKEPKDEVGFTLKCEMENCAYETSVKRYLTDHIKRVHCKSKEAQVEPKDEVGSIMKCEMENCAYETTVKRYLAAHIKRVHCKSKEAQVVVKELKKEEDSQESEEIKEERYKCLIENCAYEATQKRYLQDHCRRKHKQN